MAGDANTRRRRMGLGKRGVKRELAGCFLFLAFALPSPPSSGRGGRAEADPGLLAAKDCVPGPLLVPRRVELLLLGQTGRVDGRVKVPRGNLRSTAVR